MCMRIWHKKLCVCLVTVLRWSNPSPFCVCVCVCVCFSLLLLRHCCCRRCVAGDVQWAPFSSTVFAAVTNDGFVHVFDLAVNRHEPICKQKVVKRSKLTKLRFSRFDPILVIGDENGAVTSMKLSPNLRRNMNDQNAYDKADEKRRLDACLRISTMLPQGE